MTGGKIIISVLAFVEVIDLSRYYALAMLLVMIWSSALPANAEEPVVTTSPTSDPYTDISADPRKPEILAVAGVRLMQGYPDKTFRPASTVTESEFNTVIDRLLVVKTSLRKPEVSESSPNKPITRAKAIVVLVRCYVSMQQIEAVENAEYVLSAYTDASEIPDWAVKPIAFSVSQRIAPPAPDLRPNDPITRSELAGILAACLGMAREEPASGDGYTGLIIDCRGMDVRRCMSVTVKDEDGNQIYPDVKNLPSNDILMGEGMISFASDPKNAKRSGTRPYTVRAIEVSGKAGEMLKISNADCALLLSAEKRDRFMAKWRVTVLVGPAPEDIPNSIQDECTDGSEAPKEEPGRTGDEPPNDSQ